MVVQCRALLLKSHYFIYSEKLISYFYFFLIHCHMQLHFVSLENKEILLCTRYGDSQDSGSEMTVLVCIWAIFICSHFIFLCFILSSNLFSSQSALPENGKGMEIGTKYFIFYAGWWSWLGKVKWWFLASSCILFTSNFFFLCYLASCRPAI